MEMSYYTIISSWHFGNSFHINYRYKTIVPLAHGGAHNDAKKAQHWLNCASSKPLKNNLFVLIPKQNHGLYDHRESKADK